MKYSKQEFFGAWLNWQIDSQNKSIFDTKKAKLKRLGGYIRALGIEEYQAMSEEEKKETYCAWESFAKEFIEISLKDKTFASQFFGMVQMKENQVNYKMADIIEKTAKDYPENLGIGEVTKPFYEVMKRVFLEIAPDAKKFF